MVSMTMPGIVQMLQSVLYNLIFMDVMQTDSWLLKVFYQDKGNVIDNIAMNPYFEDNGFQSTQALKNFGSTILFVLLYLFGWVMIVILYPCR